MLYRLLYTSEARLGGDGPARAAAVAEITAAAAAANARRGLTGVLLLVEDTFIQALEGPLDAVERVFEAICGDFRHTKVKVVELVPAEGRMFGEWHMRHLVRDGEPARVALNRDLDEIRFTVDVNAQTALKQMLGVFDRAA